MAAFQVFLTTFLYLNVLTLVSGNYTLNITLVSYINHNNWCSECSDDELGCCDNYDVRSCVGGNRCDTYFEYCLLPLETAITTDRIWCTPVATSTVLLDDGPIDFTQSVVLGLSNPLQLSGISNAWSGTLLQISALDSDGSRSFDLIDVFHLRIANMLGSATIAGYHDLTQMELAYRVTCNEAFYGDACQFFNVNDCPSLDICGDNGTCIDGNHSYSCQCDHGYKGDHCELIDDCFGVNCSSQGLCMDGDNLYTCLCHAGFTGTNCEINIDDCISVSCSGQGKCVDGNSSHVCVCNPGFTGEDCAINIDDCVNKNCSGNGVCIDGANSFNCSGDAGKVQSRLVLIIGVTLGGFSFLLVIIFTIAFLTLCRPAHRASNNSQATEVAPKRPASFNLTANIGYGVIAGAQHQSNEGCCSRDQVGPRPHKDYRAQAGDMESHSM